MPPGAGVADGGEAAFEAQGSADARSRDRGGGGEGDATCGHGFSEGAEHGPVMDGLGVGIEALGSPMGGAGDRAALDEREGEA